LFFDICVDWDALLLCDLCTAVTFDVELAITEILKLWLMQDGATVPELASFLLQYRFAISSNVVASPCFSILPETCDISPNLIRRPHVSVWMNFKLSSGCSNAEMEGPGVETRQIVLLATVLRGSHSGGLTPGRLYLSHSPPMSQMYRYELGLKLFLYCFRCFVGLCLPTLRCVVLLIYCFLVVSCCCFWVL